MNSYGQNDMKQGLPPHRCYWHPVHKHQIYPMGSAPAQLYLYTRVGTGWKLQTSLYDTFWPCWFISSLAVSLWHFPCKYQKGSTRNEKKKKNPSSSNSLHLGLALCFVFFSEAFSCLSVRSSSLYSPRPKADPTTYGILSEIIQEIFPVGGLYLGIFLFILSCAWHQLQVLFLFWMERILSSIPKGPFGPFLKK